MNMFRLKEHHKESLHRHGKKVSQKMANLVHASHFRKVILHNKKHETIMSFPLLLGIIVTPILPLFVTFFLLIFFIYGGNLVIEKEE